VLGQKLDEPPGASLLSERLGLLQAPLVSGNERQARQHADPQNTVVAGGASKFSPLLQLAFANRAAVGVGRET
jgi:hypothetical protein